MKLKGLLILLVLFAGCKRQNTNIIDKPEFTNYSVTAIDSVDLGNVLHIWSWKLDRNRVSIFSPASKGAFLFVYSYPDFKFLYKYGKTGQGPGEFIAADWAKPCNDNELVLYDIMKKKLYSFTVSDSAVSEQHSYNLYGGDGFENLSKPFVMICQINDSIFLLKAEMPDNSYLEVADLKNGNIITSFPGIVPRPDRVGYAPWHYTLEYSDKTVISAFECIERIEISEINEQYEIKNKLVIGNDKNQAEIPWQKRVVFYSDVKCDGKRIYTVFQGKPYDRQDSSKSSIEIYDLEGKPVGKLLLDRYIKLILLSPDSKFIYGYDSSIEEDKIFVYEIPPKCR